MVVGHVPYVSDCLFFLFQVWELCECNADEING